MTEQHTKEASLVVEAPGKTCFVLVAEFLKLKWGSISFKIPTGGACLRNHSVNIRAWGEQVVIASCLEPSFVPDTG